jgi:putative salt-induced outer membrane protein
MRKPLLSALAVRGAQATLAVATIVAPTRVALAQTPPPDPSGAPPPDAKALVDQQKATDAPKVDKPVDGTSATLSAGAQLASGNSRSLAITGTGIFETRYHDNGVGASVLGNYSQGAPPGDQVVETAGNIQGRVRYDRYVLEEASVFLIATGRNDRFQGIDFRLNLDPGFKYLFVKQNAEALWAELGYDFQYDVRRDDSLGEVNAMGMPILGANGQQLMLPKTATDNSVRFFYGVRHAFNKEVTLALGLEYLQSFVDSTRYRVNFDLLFAAKISGGLAVGLGGSARYDHDPLPGKENLDTTMTANLIYSFTSSPPQAKVALAP